MEKQEYSYEWVLPTKRLLAEKRNLIYELWKRLVGTCGRGAGTVCEISLCDINVFMTLAKIKIGNNDGFDKIKRKTQQVGIKS